MHRQSKTRAGNHQRHTRTRNVSLPTQANHTARGARKQPPNQGAIHAALDRLRFRPFCLLRPSALALLCLGFITGAGGLPRRLDFSHMCPAWVPVAPAVGAVSLCLCMVPRWHRVRCDVLVRCMYSGLVGGLPFVACVALLACVGGLAFVVCAFGVSCSSSCLLMHS